MPHEQKTETTLASQPQPHEIGTSQRNVWARMGDDTKDPRPFQQRGSSAAEPEDAVTESTYESTYGYSHPQPAGHHSNPLYPERHITNSPATVPTLTPPKLNKAQKKNHMRIRPRQARRAQTNHRGEEMPVVAKAPGKLHHFSSFWCPQPLNFIKNTRKTRQNCFFAPPLLDPGAGCVLVCAYIFDMSNTIQKSKEKEATFAFTTGASCSWPAAASLGFYRHRCRCYCRCCCCRLCSRSRRRHRWTQSPRLHRRARLHRR